MNNTALVRIKKEYDMIKNDPPENFNAYPIKDDLFSWHFTIRGADETEFENGIYHGLIKLPTNYPFKPPSIVFLTPNGRFDINVDVCLSVTKFHKEEWQAAWTIRTILEAIIAFFPVKEDHDAIGAIDYPVEARKKLALASKKWKCEVCGPIVDLIPEKKARKESTNTQEEESSPQAEKTESCENKPVKREKAKHKKIDYDRKSLLSNIEGVIPEDVNEDEEDVELKRHQTNIGNDGKSNLKAKEINKEQNDIQKLDSSLKRSNSDTTNNQTNFADYLKQLRLSQFEQEKEAENKAVKVDNEPRIEESQNIIEKITPVVNKVDQADTYLKHKQEEKNLNILKRSAKEELAFCDILATIKIHNTNSTAEEVLKELTGNKGNPEMQSNKDIVFGDLVTKLIEKNSTQNNQSQSALANQNQNMKEFINIFSDREKLEALMKQKNNALKYVTRRNYEEAKIKRQRILSSVMVITIICIFIIYYYCRNYL